MHLDFYEFSTKDMEYCSRYNIDLLAVSQYWGNKLKQQQYACINDHVLSVYSASTSII